MDICACLTLTSFHIATCTTASAPCTWSSEKDVVKMQALTHDRRLSVRPHGLNAILNWKVCTTLSFVKRKVEERPLSKLISSTSTRSYHSDPRTRATPRQRQEQATDVILSLQSRLQTQLMIRVCVEILPGSTQCNEMKEMQSMYGAAVFGFSLAFTALTAKVGVRVCVCV